MALNDAWPLARGEIVLIVDADGRPNRDVLRWMVPHFVKVPRVAAVTGNPRVVNTTTLLAKMQAIEFSATVSVLRRAQVTWDAS
jgi:poly-beta-1,6-N-acetyl-D-glucosamine synthase